MNRALGIGCASSCLLLSNCSTSSDSSGAPGNTAKARIEWPAYSGDAASQRWSSASEITPQNVTRLRPVWSWETGEVARQDSSTGVVIAPGRFEATPLDIGDTLYLSTPFNRVVALDARSGHQLWAFDPGATKWGLIANDHAGFVHRGVAAWLGAEGRRIFHASRWELYALDAHTGLPVAGFGSGGKVDLSEHLRWPVDRLQIGNTSPPVVWGDIVIVGSSIGDNLIFARDPPGDVQAFDARTGRRLWRWDPVPRAGTPERNTWSGQSADRAGHLNVWAPFSVDSARGLVYLPVSAASNDWYGGRRLGDNLFAESLVCLDARTGQRVWHQQLVHHGLWDYDLAAAPVLTTIRRQTDTVGAVLVAGKTGYLYAFDRVSGRSLWPLEERAAPSSDVPGEQTAALQPHATWPEPFAQQGFALDDVVDFTPALREEALALIRDKRLGPLFTPPSREGTIVMPGWIGGAGWGSTAVDPERQLVFIKATNRPVLARVLPAGDNIGFRLDSMTLNPEKPLLLRLPAYRTWTRRAVEGVDLPINKPPYGTLTAYDLVSGAKRWSVTLGDMPAIRNHPILRSLNLPPLGVAGAPGGIATASGLVFVSGGGSTLYAISSETGAALWSWAFDQVAYSNPMTYRAADGHQYVLVATGEGNGARLQAFSLPK